MKFIKFSVNEIVTSEVHMSNLSTLNMRSANVSHKLFVKSPLDSFTTNLLKVALEFSGFLKHEVAISLSKFMLTINTGHFTFTTFRGVINNLE